MQASASTISRESDIIPSRPKETLLRSGAQGFFVHQNQLYGTVKRWSLRTGVGKAALKDWLCAIGAESERGLDLSGKQRDFYCEKDIQSVLVKFRRPKADRSGYLLLDGKHYATVKALQRTAFKTLGAEVIAKRIAEHALKPLEGLTHFNRPHLFFAKEDVEKILEADLSIEHRLDKLGFKRVNDVLYGNRRAWCNELAMGNTAWSNRNVKPSEIFMKNHLGRRCVVYAEKDVRSACADIVRLKHKARKNGFFEIDGERYGTRFAWSNELELSTNSISKRIKGDKAVEGRDASGAFGKFFAESYVRSVCGDLLDKPKADGNGYIFVDGERYGIQTAICTDFEVTWAKVEECIGNRHVKTVEGKNRATHNSLFYSVDDILQYCAHIILMPKADGAGVFFIDGERFATRKRWNMLLDLPHHRVERLLAASEIMPVKGLDSGGHRQDFYGELDIRRLNAEIEGRDPVEALIDHLPKYLVNQKSSLHEGLAGDTVSVFPRRLYSYIEGVLLEFGIQSHSGRRLGIIRGRPTLLYESELRLLTA